VLGDAGLGAIAGVGGRRGLGEVRLVAAGERDGCEQEG
jgi:hypothetical protein